MDPTAALPISTTDPTPHTYPSRYQSALAAAKEQVYALERTKLPHSTAVTREKLVEVSRLLFSLFSDWYVAGISVASG